MNSYTSSTFYTYSTFILYYLCYIAFVNCISVLLSFYRIYTGVFNRYSRKYYVYFKKSPSLYWISTKKLFLSHEPPLTPHYEHLWVSLLRTMFLWVRFYWPVNSNNIVMRWICRYIYVPVLWFYISCVSYSMLTTQVTGMILYLRV